MSSAWQANNIAYDVAYASQRERLLKLVLRDWGLKLRGPRDEARPQRNAYLKQAVTTTHS